MLLFSPRSKGYMIKHRIRDRETRIGSRVEWKKQDRRRRRTWSGKLNPRTSKSRGGPFGRGKRMEKKFYEGLTGGLGRLCIPEKVYPDPWADVQRQRGPTMVHRARTVRENVSGAVQRPLSPPFSLSLSLRSSFSHRRC